MLSEVAGALCLISNTTKNKENNVLEYEDVILINVGADIKDWWWFVVIKKIIFYS